MQMPKYPKIHRVGLLFAILACFSAGSAWGQEQKFSYTPSSAIDQQISRAEQEAEESVSLSAERIIQIARDEVGLLLQIKKAVVRRAYEQGRILDPENLTDDAVFRLIREDQNARVIATHEIVERGYVKAKPDRIELARTLPCRQQQPLITESPMTKEGVEPLTPQKTQEESYWLKHESDSDCDLTPYIPYGMMQPSYMQPQTTGAPSQQQQYPNSPFMRPQYQQQQQLPPQQVPQSPFSVPQQQYPWPNAPQTTPPNGANRQLQMAQMQLEDHFGMDS